MVVGYVLLGCLCLSICGHIRTTALIGGVVPNAGRSGEGVVIAHRLLVALPPRPVDRIYSSQSLFSPSRRGARPGRSSWCWVPSVGASSSACWGARGFIDFEGEFFCGSGVCRLAALGGFLRRGENSGYGRNCPPPDASAQGECCLFSKSALSGIGPPHRRPHAQGPFAERECRRSFLVRGHADFPPLRLSEDRPELNFRRRVAGGCEFGACDLISLWSRGRKGILGCARPPSIGSKYLIIGEFAYLHNLSRAKFCVDVWRPCFRI